MNIVFLDFDGVMDTASYDQFLVLNGLPECDGNGRPVFDPRCVENLKQIVTETNACIVVTSDWKYFDSYEDLLEMWRQRDLPGFMADTTPNVSKHRGDEIAHWLNECKIECNYVIIDDLDKDNFNTDQLDKLVIVDSFYGLTENATQQAIAILKTKTKP